MLAEGGAKSREEMKGAGCRGDKGPGRRRWDGGQSPESLMYLIDASPHRLSNSFLSFSFPRHCLGGAAAVLPGDLLPVRR